MKKKAAKYTQQWLNGVTSVMVHNVKPGRYAGRIVGNISVKGQYLSETLIKAGFC